MVKKSKGQINRQIIKDITQLLNNTDCPNYDIGTTLKVELNGTLYVHPEHFCGSEARLYSEPKSNKPGWLGVSVIYAQYAGWRPGKLKLRLNMLQDPMGKNVLMIYYSQIRDISDIFDD